MAPAMVYNTMQLWEETMYVHCQDLDLLVVFLLKALFCCMKIFNFASPLNSKKTCLFISLIIELKLLYYYDYLHSSAWVTSASSHSSESWPDIHRFIAIMVEMLLYLVDLRSHISLKPNLVFFINQCFLLSLLAVFVTLYFPWHYPDWTVGGCCSQFSCWRSSCRCVLRNCCKVCSHDWYANFYNVVDIYFRLCI